MQSTKILLNEELKFNLDKLLKTVFAPKKGEKLAILIDLENPEEIKNLEFLKNEACGSQKKAYEVFYLGAKKSALEFGACDFFAYKMTGGNNLELPGEVLGLDGQILDLKKDIYSKYDIILCIGKYSATAPLAFDAKEYGFRGAAIPGVNEVILNTGLSLDYMEVAKITEKFALGLTEAESADIDFEMGEIKTHLHLYLGDQAIQKNDGLCRKKRQVLNLPAGKVYFVPYDAEGSFPMKLQDGTLAVAHVSKGRIKKLKFISGDAAEVTKFQKKIDVEKVSGIIGELGFGTLNLPFSDSYIQDGKIFGSFHLGIGRNDHLHGSVNLSRFIDKKNASHDDILFSPTKTPEIKIVKLTIKIHGKTEVLIENDEPQEYFIKLL